jgi:hypothetical protein
MKPRRTFTEWMQYIGSVHYANRTAMDRAIENVYQYQLDNERQ